MRGATRPPVNILLFQICGQRGDQLPKVEREATIGRLEQSRIGEKIRSQQKQAANEQLRQVAYIDIDVGLTRTPFSTSLVAYELRSQLPLSELDCRKLGYLNRNCSLNR